MHTQDGPHFAYSISYSDAEGHHVIGDTSRTAAGLIDRLGQAISRLLDHPAFAGASMPGYTRVDAAVWADTQTPVEQVSMHEIKPIADDIEPFGAAFAEADEPEPQQEEE